MKGNTALIIALLAMIVMVLTAIGVRHQTDTRIQKLTERVEQLEREVNHQ